MEVTFVPSLEESRPGKVAVLNVWAFMRPWFGFHHLDKGERWQAERHYL
jgi:hypothetical protein